MDIMVIATVSVAITNVALVILYLVNINKSSRTIDDLINKLMSKNYIEYSNVELAKNREETKRKAKIDPSKNKDLIRL